MVLLAAQRRAARLSDNDHSAPIAAQHCLI
jgi:hypothetical protein